ncbi:MAG: hypothetical protein GY799_20905 [Desulfobulbaceae bacterium]|nr:hypothetical protein [Desulfobulbaceae bacterium]
MPWWNAILAPVTNLISKPLEQYGERKAIKLRSETKVHELEAEAQVKTAEVTLEMAKTGQIIQSDWDARAQDNMKRTWMDEIIAVTFLFPIWVIWGGVLWEFVTVPGTVISVAMIGAVSALAALPLWYVCLVCGVAAAYLGLRWLVQPLVQGLTGNFGKTNPTMKLK